MESIPPPRRGPNEAGDGLGLSTDTEAHVRAEESILSGGPPFLGPRMPRRTRPILGPGRGSKRQGRKRRGFFYFIFSFRFLQKYIFVFEIYRNIAGRPAAGRPGPGRPAAGRQGLLCKNFCENICAQVLAGRPAAGRPALPPLYKGWLVPHPSFASLKFQKPRKEREAKPCRIFEPATAGNQNSSTIYK